jgi:hypothetical protein
MQLTRLWQSLSTSVSNSRRKRVDRSDALQTLHLPMSSIHTLIAFEKSYRLLSGPHTLCYLHSPCIMDRDIPDAMENVKGTIPLSERSSSRTTDQPSTKPVTSELEERW